MTDIEQKALELVNSVAGVRRDHLNQCECWELRDALLLAVKAHELDKARHAAEMREQAERFSEAAGQVALLLKPYGYTGTQVERILSPYLTTPVDPLYDAIKEVVELGRYDTAEQTQLLRAALDARGLAIVKKEAVNGIR